MKKLLLKSMRYLHSVAKPDLTRFGRNWHMFSNKCYTSDLISEALLSNKPTMIARFGSTELICMTNYLGVNYQKKYKSIKGYISNQTPPWWWEKASLNNMKDYSGFFPNNLENINKFCELMIKDLPNVDILGSWLKQESFFSNELSSAKKVMLEDLEPFFIPNPWTKALKNKKVLVVHPFVKSIQAQYGRRDKIFENGLLPTFELETIQAVQSLGGGKGTGFNDWFAALDSMKEKISKAEFDVCILGCGAYGFPLASFVKEMGKQSIHLGGVTQLLFGIKGARWEQYIVYPYANLFNEHWIRPGEVETPENSNTIEGGCYW